MYRVAVIGSNGQLGTELRVVSEDTPYSMLFVSREQVDLTNEHSIQSFFEENRIDILINCAAYTAVDAAESNQRSADLVNHVGVRVLAECCKANKIYLVHISTDYVFGGTNGRPFIESHETLPISTYGKTKLAGEIALKETGVHHAIIRTSWLYSEYGRNFVKTICRLSSEKTSLNVVWDQVGTPTYARDLAFFILENLEKLMKNRATVYHYANEGVASWYDLAQEIVSFIGSECTVVPVLSSEYKTEAPRPFYSVLDKSLVKRQFGCEIPYWKDSLHSCLERLR